MQKLKILNYASFASIALLAGAMLSGCSLRPDMPEVETSVEMKYQFDHYNLNDKWWEDFKDPRLDELVASALENNHDLLLALNNLESARIQMNLAKIEFLPNSSLGGDSGKNRTSAKLPSGAPVSYYNLATLSASASWEIDLWGRVRNGARAGIANFEASEYDYENARLSIISSVANTYFMLVSLQEQEQILKDSLASYEQTLAYRKAEYDSGSIDELTYSQAKASVDDAKNQLVTLQDSLISTRTALALLAGKVADFIFNESVQTSKSTDISVPEVPSGIAADILERRADVAAALKRLKAANAQIGVARANYFPRLSLTGSLGYSSNEFDRLFINQARTWSYGGSLIMPLLDFSRTYQNVQLAWKDQNASMLNYDKTLKNALGEVHDALKLRQNANEKFNAAQDLRSSWQKVFDLSQARFNEGYSTHLEYLDAQRGLLSAKLGYARAQLGTLNAVVEVYKALGGGFKTKQSLKSDLD